MDKKNQNITNTDITTLKDVIFLNNFFFIIISIKMMMTKKESEHHLKNIHKRFLKNDKIVNDLSPMIRNCFFHYLEFLEFTKTIK